MATRVGINGFGRIGRQVLKGILERHPDTLEVVAINDLVDSATNAHLFKYDSNYGRFEGTVAAEGNDLVVNGKKIRVFSERAPADVPWSEEGVEIVVKGTVKKVIISAPARNEDVTLVLGVNQDAYDPERHHIISNASCTTNGLAPVVKVLLDNFGFQKGQMTTVHSYTNSQRVLDVATKDLREARAAGLNIIPTSTGAARALKLVIPEVDGKLDGLAYRVPTPTVSIVEVVALTEKDTTVEEVNQAMFRASAERMAGILAITDEPVVSMDLKGNENSSIVDGLSTNVVAGNLVKVASWYDNEWGYACRIGDLCQFLAERGL
jgi:glyceraldehyde 3-phosphate dehydrogenase